MWTMLPMLDQIQKVIWNTIENTGGATKERKKREWENRDFEQRIGQIVE